MFTVRPSDLIPSRLQSFLVVLTYFLLSVTSGFSQEDKIRNEINQQVWKPFIESFNKRDHATFESLHSRDVIRVVRDDQEVFGYEKYFRSRPDSLRSNWNVWIRKIELRFIERLASDMQAFEVGYYKTISVNQKTGERRVGYGKFHVLLRKENGIWKILMDADANEGTNEAIFIKGTPIE